MGVFEYDGAEREYGEENLGSVAGLGNVVLYQNARWFARIRWVIIAVLVILGFGATLAPDVLLASGLEPPQRWPWVLASILTVTNVLFCIHLNRLATAASGVAVQTNIWMQIVSDMLVVTALVHLVGSTQGFFAFIYLFHIALACIFFSRKGSFLVTALAGSLYMACILAETAGFGARSSVLVDAPHPATTVPRLSFLLASSAILIWFVVWYMASTLSETVRKRDRQLAVTNAQLVRAQVEKNQIMLRTTHDLKAPFAGIETNIQVLKALHWDALPASLRAVVAKIETRSVTLRERIGDILKLGELRANSEQEPKVEEMDLIAVLESAIRDVADKAKQKGVDITLNPSEAVTIVNDAGQLLILFRNLVANAVFYSGQNSPVEISIASGDSAHVRIVDRGIGISEDALPLIFDEYYRTKEAMRFNKMSTGLGLAIVKQIARNLGLKISVSSTVGKGTVFEVIIPEIRRQTHGINPGH